MGRKKIHLTKEAYREANNKARKKYYEKNKVKERAARMERYYANKKLSELQQDT